MPTIELPAGRVEYHVAGPESSDAPPVVFVHGLLVNSELWAGVAASLETEGVRSYRPELPLGSHTIPLKADAELSPRGVAQIIIDFLEALDLHDVTLVGNDTGGALCQFVLDTDHSRIGRLVLTNCDAFDVFPPSPFDLIVKIGRRRGGVSLLSQSMRSRLLRHSVLGYGGLVSKPLDPALTGRWVAPTRHDAGIRHDTRRFLSGADPAELLDVSTRLGDFGKPVRLVWGTQDPYFTIDLGRRLRAAFGDHAELVEVPGERTFIPLDNPERVASEIRSMSHARD